VPGRDAARRPALAVVSAEPGRRQARRAALVLLYQHDVAGRPVAELAERYRQDTRGPVPEYTRELVEGVLRDREALDMVIGEHARGWSPERISPIERAALRIATYELTTGDVPPSVAIDEAVRLSKRYASPEASTFVNGVLGATARALGVGH
jgi:N utilization substance protein B